MANRRTEPGTGQWAYAYNPPKENKRTIGAPIPEPVAR